MPANKKLICALVKTSGGQLLFLNTGDGTKKGTLTLPGLVVEGHEDWLGPLQAYMMEILGLFLTEHSELKPVNDQILHGYDLYLVECRVKGDVGQTSTKNSKDVEPLFTSYGYQSFIYLTGDEAELVSFTAKFKEFIKLTASLSLNYYK